jgi:hypothetical protein
VKQQSSNLLHFYKAADIAAAPAAASRRALKVLNLNLRATA